MLEPDKEYFIKMLSELRAIREKYGLPRGLLFSPDRLEISTKRNSYDNVHLSYKEYFDYLPDTVLDLVIPASINMIVQIGVPRECVERIGKNGVGLEIDSTTILVVAMLLSELSIQKRFTEEELQNVMTAGNNTIRALTDTSDLMFEWDEEIGHRYLSILQKSGAILLANPSAVVEMQEVQKKYSASAEKLRTVLSNKQDQKSL
jgi:hypothetical protein